MPQIDKNKVYSFFFGSNSNITTGVFTATRRVDLFDTSGNPAGSIFFYPAGVSIPNDAEGTMNRPVSDYDDILAFIQNAPVMYFGFESAGNNYCYLSDHDYSKDAGARPLKAAR